MEFRNFKAYYLLYMSRHLRSEFLKLLSYTSFVQLEAYLVTSMSVYLQSLHGDCTSISFIDATALIIGHNRRIFQHRVC